MSESYSFGRNLLVIGLGRMSTQFVGFLLIPLYTFSMPQRDFGVLDLIITVSAIAVPVMTLHLDMAAFRFLIDARGRRRRTLSIVRQLLHTTGLQVVAWVSLAALASWFVGDLLVLASGLYVCGLICSALTLQIARGLGYNTIYAGACVLTAAITVPATVGLVVLGQGGAGGALTALASGNFAGAAFALVKLPEVRAAIRFRGNAAPIRPLLNYTAPLVPNAISWWVISGVDRLVIPTFLSIEALGLFAYAARYSTVLTALATIYSLTWSEAASVKHAKGESGADQHFGRTILTFSLLGTGVVGGFAWLLPLITPPAYSQAMQYIPLLVGGACLYAVSTFFGGLYVATFNSRRVAASSVWSAILKLLSTALLVPIVGLWGAAIGTVVAYMFLCTSRFLDLRHSPFALHLPMLQLSIGVFSFGAACVGYFLLEPWAGLLIAAAAGLLLLMLMIIWHRPRRNLRNEDRHPQ